MKRSSPRLCAVGVLAVFGVGCRSAPIPVQTGLQSRAGAQTAVKTQVPLGRYPYVTADVKFMTDMIPHHAQAVVMAGWAPSHGASTGVRLLCERIVVGQTDEIRLMQTWLRERHEAVPSASSTHMKMMMNGLEHEMLTPGMLSDEEMAQLDKSRGLAFDRLFLTGMIRHHRGAITMVDELFGSQGAGQDEVVFRFGSDVYADQSTEIDRMQKMLTPLQGKD